MLKQFDRRGARARRHRRVRVRVAGSGQRPRLSVFRSLHHVYAQLIDDETGRTVAAASTAQLKSSKKDMEAEIGDLGWEVCWSVRFDCHDTDLSRVRHQLFRGRLADLAGWADREVLELRGALDGVAGER